MSIKTVKFPTAKLVSEDLRLDVRENTQIFTTKGKAYLIESTQIDQDVVVSTILQETSSGSPCAFQFLHSGKEDITKYFKKELKRFEDRWMDQVIPLMFIGIMSVLLFYVFRMALSGEELIVTRYSAINFFMMILAFGSVTFVVAVKISIMEVDTSIFSVRGRFDRVFDFILHDDLVQIQCYTYRGILWHEKLPDLLIWGWTSSDFDDGLEGGLRTLAEIQREEAEIHSAIDDAHRELILEENYLRGLQRDFALADNKEGPLAEQLQKQLTSVAKLQKEFDDFKEKQNPQIKTLTKIRKETINGIIKTGKRVLQEAGRDAEYLKRLKEDDYVDLVSQVQKYISMISSLRIENVDLEKMSNENRAIIGDMVSRSSASDRTSSRAGHDPLMIAQDPIQNNQGNSNDIPVSKLILVFSIVAGGMIIIYFIYYMVQNITESFKGTDPMAVIVIGVIVFACIAMFIGFALRFMDSVFNTKEGKINR